VNRFNFQIDDVDIAGALAIAEQRALDPVGTGHHPELGCRHGPCPGRCGVQRQHHRSRFGTLRWNHSMSVARKC